MFPALTLNDYHDEEGIAADLHSHEATSSGKRVCVRNRVFPAFTRSDCNKE